MMAKDRSFGLLFLLTSRPRFATRHSGTGYPWLAPLAAVVGAGHAATLPHWISHKAPALYGSE
jgi:hypothetical protein